MNETSVSSLFFLSHFRQCLKLELNLNVLKNGTLVVLETVLCPSVPCGTCIHGGLTFFILRVVFSQFHH